MSESITQLTNDLIASYAKVGGINHLDGGNLPSKFAIASITTDLLRLLLPGFFDEKPIQTAELKVEIAMLMDGVSGRLEDEITKSIEYKPPGGKTADRPRQLARELTLKFLGTFPAIRELLKTDVEAAYAGDPAAISHEEVVVAYPDREVVYAAGELSDLRPAFAITVHRSQGGEFDGVVLPLVTQHFMMLQRNLLYTAITRARKLVVLVGSRRALELAIQNTDQSRRESALAEKLIEATAR